nr:SH3 domain-containing protein PJ696.02-like [Tanacetum cinerariifolium]
MEKRSKSSLDFSNYISFSSIGARGSCFEEATPTRFVQIKLSPKQVGGELIDFIIVLHDYKAVKTFCSHMHFSLGSGCSVAAGAVGRVLEADLRACHRGSRMCYTYSCSK